MPKSKPKTNPPVVPAAMSIDDTATYIGLSRHTLYREAALGATSKLGLKFTRYPGVNRVVVLREDADAFLARARNAA